MKVTWRRTKAGAYRSLIIVELALRGKDKQWLSSVERLFCFHQVLTRQLALEKVLDVVNLSEMR
jgi:hypothetical protein